MLVRLSLQLHKHIIVLGLSALDLLDHTRLVYAPLVDLLLRDTLQFEHFKNVRKLIFCLLIYCLLSLLV